MTHLVVKNDNEIDVDVSLLNKTSTRLPEATFLQFNPNENIKGEWSMNKLNSWIGNSDIVNGGSQHLHGITDSGIRFESITGKTLQIKSLDLAVASFGELVGYPTPTNVTADTEKFGTSFYIEGNLWGTNYVQWFPFSAEPVDPMYDTSKEYYVSRHAGNVLARVKMIVVE